MYNLFLFLQKLCENTSVFKKKIIDVSRSRFLKIVFSKSIINKFFHSLVLKKNGFELIKCFPKHFQKHIRILFF